MEIVELKTLTDEERDSYNSIPEEYVKRLKKLTIEQQFQCIYLRRTEAKHIDVLVENDPSYFDEYEKCFKLSRWKLEKVYVYDGIIIAVADAKSILVKFGTAYYSEKRLETYSYMDSHDHRVYESERYVTDLFYLLIYKNHEYLTDIAPGNNSEG